MRIFNKEKTQELTDYDSTLGYLRPDKIVANVIPAKKEVKEQFHYEYKEYPNGGKDRIKIIDVAYVPASEEKIEYKKIQVFIPFTDEEATEYLRDIREGECFSVINRGQPWYNTLTEEQKTELKAWYQAWLDVTETREVPTKPSWLEGK